MKNTRKPTPYAVKFTRDPRFTPASLTTHQLGRIETLALCIVKRTNGPTVTLCKDDADDLATWWFSSCRGGFGKQREIATMVRKHLDNDAAWTYLVNCIKWVIACGNNGGWIRRSAPVTNSRVYWAQVRGSY